MADISWLSLVRSQRAIAVVRAPTLEMGIKMARSVAAGGMKLIEITWDSPQPAKLVAHLRTELSTCVIGAGTLLSAEQVQEAIAAGAEFLFSPHLNLDLIRVAIDWQVPIIPGALSPSEIVSAWQAGAASVKVFPVQALGGAEYIRHLQGPLAAIPLIPTGGVTLENARTFIDAGAIAVGLAGQLFPKQAIATQNWIEITERTKDLRQRLGVSC
jgi:2-dehydro-3-deoxyphosphogluconate aldolase / (4S)-4-hydroxy-2-oxoglutarate aldolase